MGVARVVIPESDIVDHISPWLITHARWCGTQGRTWPPPSSSNQTHTYTHSPTWERSEMKQSKWCMWMWIPDTHSLACSPWKATWCSLAPFVNITVLVREANKQSKQWMIDNIHGAANPIPANKGISLHWSTCFFFSRFSLFLEKTSLIGFVKNRKHTTHTHARTSIGG